MRSQVILLLSLLTGYCHGHPAPHQLHGRATVDLDQYRSTLKPTFVISDNLPTNVKSLGGSDDIDVATSVVKALFPSASYRLVNDHHTSNIGITHVNFKQTANGHDIDNADFHVNVNAATHKVISYGNTFFSGTIPSSSIVDLTKLALPLAALQTVSKTLGLPLGLGAAVPQGSSGAFTFSKVDGVVSDPKADLVWMQQPGSTQLVPSWRIETDLGTDWLISYVNAADASKILNVVNWNANDNYLVYAYAINNPSVAPNGRTFENNPQDPRAYPKNLNGWQQDGSHTYNTLIGNNVLASGNPTGNDNYYANAVRPTETNGVFNFYYNQGDYTYTEYTNASATQLFYYNNKIHDLLYVLGFDEASGNFQYNNFGKGGQALDNVVAYTQDGQGFDNAFMRTPPDGQRPQMSMFMFTKSEPYRDSSFDLDIVMHEYCHGLSNRLTGGPSNSNCLTTLEAGGLGEGWSDFYAYAARLTGTATAQTDVASADWTYNNPKGARPYLYSNDQRTNPYTYASLNSVSGVHGFGAVWATILYGVYWNLVDGYGNTPNNAEPQFYSDLTTFPRGGRYAAWKLVLDGMKIQPCNPTFLQARDAIIQADQQATNGHNFCRIWNGFAVRGMGTGAVQNNAGKYINSNDVPTSCGVSRRMVKPN